MPKERYFDHAATTPCAKEVVSAMLPYFNKEFGNPSNLYGLGLRAKAAVEKSTQTIANFLNCRSDEIVYTGSATEADNLAIQGIAKEKWKDGNKERLKIITSQIEHKGILAACEALQKEGVEIVKLPVLKNGVVDLDILKKELDGRTILVSVTTADSETGTIQPIAEISEVIRNFRNSKHEARNSKVSDFDIRISDFPYLHTDASQAAGYLDLNVAKLGVDLMTISAHKIYGPKGIGALFVRKGVNITPIIHGGGQHGKLRSGTENVPAIVGFARAVEICKRDQKKENTRLKKMRDTLEQGIKKTIPKVVINGNPKKRLPGFSNISFLDVEGEAMLLYLNELGILVNTGSACNSQSLEPSYVLSALGNPYEYIHGSIRFSLGKGNKMEDVKYVLKYLPEVVQKLRTISPLNLKLGQTKKISDPRAFIGGQTPHFITQPSPKRRQRKEKNAK